MARGFVRYCGGAGFRFVSAVVCGFVLWCSGVGLHQKNQLCHAIAYVQVNHLFKYDLTTMAGADLYNEVESWIDDHDLNGEIAILAKLAKFVV